MGLSKLAQLQLMVNGCGDYGHNAQLAVEQELGTEQQPPAMDHSMVDCLAVGVGQRLKLAQVNISILCIPLKKNVIILHPPPAGYWKICRPRAKHYVAQGLPIAARGP